MNLRNIFLILLLTTCFSSHFHSKKIVKGSIYTFSLHSSNLVKGSEPYFNYQWGLDNRGYIVEHEIDDIHKTKKKSKPGFDIGWSQFREKIDQTIFKKQVVIAVLDSGVAYTHPDLQNQFYKNSIECNEIGLPDPRPEKDNDNNGYKGDCLGWDFTKNEVLKDNEVAFKIGSQPLDDLGHGTHVAGIIAATTNNEIGVSGVSDKIKILPIKVTFSGDNLENLSNDEYAPITERITKGIEYAISRKVDVINISLGWPKFIDNSKLRKTVKKAIDSGISIVAAVGNNNHSSPIFPCSYERVICVGSIDLDGSISSFSNYGGHVDILAPGDHILSTIPQGDNSLTFGGRKGYGIKSGTSQSAPFISAMVALLKSSYPKISHDQIIARLKLSSKNPNLDEKFVLDGVAKLDRLFEPYNNSKVVRPQFKGLTNLVVDEKDGGFSFELSLKNYWKNSAQLSLSLSFNSSSIVLNRSKFSKVAINPFSERKIKVIGRVTDLKSNSDPIFHVEMNVFGEKKRTFTQSINFSRDLMNTPQLVRIPVTKLDKSEISQLVEVKKRKDDHFLPEYFIAKPLSESGTKFKLYKKIEKSFSPLKEVIFAKSNSIVEVYKIDADQDGAPDYFVHSRNNKENAVFFSYLKDDLSPLFKGSTEIEVNYEKVLYKGHIAGELQFLPSGLLGHSQILQPVFYGLSRSTPEADRYKDPLEFIDEENPEYRFIYFQIGIAESSFKFTTHQFDTVSFYRIIREKLGMRTWQQVRIIHVYPMTESDYLDKSVRALLVSNNRDNFEIYQVKFFAFAKKEHQMNNFFEIQSTSFDGQILFDQTPIEVADLESPFTLSSRWAYVRSHYGYRGEINVLRKEGHEVETSAQFELEDPSESILGFIRVFERNKDLYAFVQSTSYLTGVEIKGAETRAFTKSLVRSNFFPGTIFRESLYPIVISKKPNNIPGVFVNDTQVTSQHVYSWIIDEDGLKRPIKYDLSIPEKCVSLSPTRWKGGMAYAFKCLKNNKAEFLYFPLN